MDKPLTKEQAHAILRVQNGADVLAFQLAMALREVEHDHPGYVLITQPRMHREDDTGPVPWFGAVATDVGIEAARQVLDAEEVA